MKERIEGIRKDNTKPKNLVKTISESEAKFIQAEFQKDVLERDWTKLYEILNHLKKLSIHSFPTRRSSDLDRKSVV